LRAHGAIEGCFHRRTGEPDFDARAFAAQRRKKVAERKARFDRLIMPNETAARAETARNGGPSELKLDAIEPLGGVLPAPADE
jgi:hypothetical protein